MQSLKVQGKINEADKSYYNDERYWILIQKHFSFIYSWKDKWTNLYLEYRHKFPPLKKMWITLSSVCVLCSFLSILDHRKDEIKSFNELNIFF